jgi:hypothetical protein
MAQVHGGREQLEKREKSQKERRQEALRCATEAELRHAWLRLQAQRRDECTEDEIEEEAQRRNLKLVDKPR